MPQGRQKIDYGQDAPTLLRNYLTAGGLLAVLGGSLRIWSSTSHSSTTMRRVASFGVMALLITSGLFTLRAALMVWSSRVGKLLEADRLLDSLQLSGDETVLDVGCGRGLLLIGAAKRLPRGRALGIDLWSQVDQGDNRKAATLVNAQVADVADRVEVIDGDMRKLPFDDGSINAVVACKAIHNIENREGRRQTIDEIVRVLKPGGQVALMDMWHVEQFADDLQAAGMQDVQISGLSFWHYPFMRTATGRKP